MKLFFAAALSFTAPLSAMFVRNVMHSHILRSQLKNSIAHHNAPSRSPMNNRFHPYATMSVDNFNKIKRQLQKPIPPHNLKHVLLNTDKDSEDLEKLIALNKQITQAKVFAKLIKENRLTYCGDKDILARLNNTKKEADDTFYLGLIGLMASSTVLLPSCLFIDAFHSVTPFLAAASGSAFFVASMFTLAATTVRATVAIAYPFAASQAYKEIDNHRENQKILESLLEKNTQNKLTYKENL